MVREVLFNQDMAVEAIHLRNRKDTDGTEGACCYGKNFSLGDVGTQDIVCRAL